MRNPVKNKFYLLGSCIGIRANYANYHNDNDD